MYDLIVENARLYPMAGSAELSHARAIGIRDGRIESLASDRSGLQEDAREVFDARNRAVLPGFIDCHTHAVFAGNRAREQRMRLAGRTYEEIARAGGGIMSSVRALRAASESQLIGETRPRLEALMREGVTAVEIKTGYGLDTQNELRMLRVIRQLAAELPLRITATFLGAHAVPEHSDKAAYMDLVVDEMLPAAAAEGLADAVDIYVESIAFDNDDLRRLAAAAAGLGLPLRAHTDQLSNIGGTAAAAELGALSCDHLEYASAEDIDALARNSTIAVLLPGAYYFLREVQKPPVSALRNAGVPMAVATDLNPGTSPVASLLTCLHFSVTLFGLSPEEALMGGTLNAARAMGTDRDCGSLEPGKLADFCIWDLPEPELLCYQLGGLAPDAIYIGGQPQ